MTQAILKQFRAEGGFKSNPSSNFGDIFATKLDVDNIIIDSNSISTKLVNQNLNLVTTGSGAVSVSRLIANTVNAQSITGNLTGNVVGNVTGNVVGNVTGNVVGNVTGNVTSTGASSFSSIAVTGGTINNTAIGTITPSTGNFTNLSATAINGPIGATTRNTAQFTLIETNIVVAESTLDSNGIGTGSIVTAGGVGVAKNVNVGGDLIVAGRAQASTPQSPQDLTNKIYVDDQSIRNLAYSVAFGL
jgi:hypothetical protein